MSYSSGRFEMNLVRAARGGGARDDVAAKMVEAGVEGERVGARLFYVETNHDSLFAGSPSTWGVDWIDGSLYYRTHVDSLGDIRLGGFYTSFHSSDDRAFDADPEDPGREVKVYGLIGAIEWKGRLAGTSARGIDWLLDLGGGFGRAEISYKGIDSGNATAARVGGRAGLAARLQGWSIEAGWRAEFLRTTSVDSFSAGEYLFHGPFLSAVFRW